MRIIHTRFHYLGMALVCVLGLSSCGGDSSQTLLSKAQSSLKAGDKKAAIIQLKSAIQKDEDNAEARFELARIQMAQGDFASAEKELRRARKAGLNPDKINPLLAQTLIRLGEFQRVLDEIPQPEEGHPAGINMLVARANAQLGLRQIEEARKNLELALRIDPKNAEIQLSLARLSVLEKKIEDAAKHLELAITSEPNNLEAWLFKGDLLRAQGKQQEAKSAYQSALKIDPQHPGARLVLADIAINENRLGDAKSEVETVLKAHPNNLLARYTQAVIDYREKKFTVARDHLADVVKTAPTYLPALFLSGSIEYALGNLQTAEAHLNKVVKAAPKHVPAIRLLAASQLRLGRASEASRTLAPALKIAPQDVGVQIVAGEIALANKSFSEASEHFAAAAKINPGSAAIRTQLGFSRLVQGDNRGMGDLQAAARMEGGEGRANTLIILTQLKNKQFDAALANIAALEKNQVPSPAIWTYRGVAYGGKQDKGRARESFLRALQIDPAFYPAAVNLAQMDLQDKHPEQARKHFENILRVQPAHLKAMLALAHLSLLNKDDKSYVNWLTKAAATNTQAIEPRILMARYLLAKGDAPQAIAIAREAANIQPGNPVTLDMLGNAQFASKDLENAQATYRKLVDLDPTKPEPRLKLAQIQATLKRPDDARKTLQEALRLKPDLLAAQYMLGDLDIKASRYEDAHKMARQIQQQVPNSPVGWILEGDTASAGKQYPVAVSAYERAYKLLPSSEILIRLVQALTRAGRTGEGEARLNAWLVSHPQDTKMRLYLAESLITRGQTQSAAAQYLILNQQIPNNFLVLNNLASLLSEVNDRRALSFAEQAYKLKPNHPAVMDTLGWLLVQQGQETRGIGLLKEALTLAPDAADTHYHLAAAFYKTGDRARARSELERLLAGGVAFSQQQQARALLNQLQNK